MSKGILGIGCSYTWGEGLYFYSELNDIETLLSENHFFDSTKLRRSHLLFKNKKTFTNLVAEKYNTWCEIGGGNGGDNVFSFNQRLTELFDETVLDSYLKSDFKLIIYQFTQLERNTNYSLVEQIEYVDYHLSKFENEGIKCISLVWPNDITEISEYYKLFSNRHVDIKYRDIVYDNFEDIINIKDNDVTVMNDFKKRNLQKNDKHLNIRGHQMIANSIIKKLEQDNFKI